MKTVFNILLAVDSEYERNLLSQLLSKRKEFKILQAASSKESLTILRKHKIDLVLLDTTISKLEDKKILKLIRNKFNQLELPLVMIAAQSETDCMVEYLKLGANDYITKPINFEILILRILTQLKISKLSEQMQLLKEKETISSMVATCGHQISTPLAVALGSLGAKNWQKKKYKIKSSLLKINNIIQKIKMISESDKENEYVEFKDLTKIIKL